MPRILHNSKVTVVVEEWNGHIKFSVTDDGPGLPEGYANYTGFKGRQRVFDLNNTTKAERGTGLGTTEAYYAILDAFRHDICAV